MKRMIHTLEYFMVLFTILSFSTIYAHALVDYHLAEITAILALILLLLRIAHFQMKKRIFRGWIRIMFVHFLLMLPVIFYSVATDKLMEFVEKFFIISPIYILLFAHYSSTGQTYDLLWRYARIMTVIAAISLVFWYAASIMRWIQPTSFLSADWGNVYQYPNYWGVYTERQFTLFFGQMYVRNQGIFCEAPMYSFCLSIAIGIRIFLPVEGNRSKIALRHGERFIKLHKSQRFSIGLFILCVTLISTVTTTGLIILILMLVMKYAQQRGHTNIVVLLKWFSALILAIIGLCIAIQIFVDKSTSESWLIRVDDFIAGFKAWKSSPIYGTGFQSYSGIDMYRSAFRFLGEARPGYSNGIVLVLAQGGILLFTIYFIPILLELLGCIKNKDFGVFTFTCIFFTELTFTLVPYTLLMLFFLGFFYGTYLERNVNG